MSEKKNLIKNTIIIAIGKLSTQIVSFLLLPLYTSKLTPKEYGVFDYISTISVFIIPIITLCMEESLFRFLIDAKKEKDRENIITQVIIYTIISTAIFVLGAFLLLKIINYEYTIFFILYIVSSIVSAISNALVRGIGKIKLYSITNFISGILVVFLNIITIVFLNMGVVGLLLSTIIANIISSIIIFVKTNIIQYISISNLEKGFMKEMIKYSIPLIPNSIAFSIISVSDRIVVTNSIGVEQNGIYSIANKFPSIISVFYGFFSLAWKESAAKMVNNEDKMKYYSDVYETMKNIIFCISILLIAVMPIVFPILINEQYSEAYIHIPILIISVYFCNIAMFISGIFIAYKDTKNIGTTTIVAAIINVIVNIALINKVGLYAASISTLIAYIFLCLYRKYKIRKYIKLKREFSILQIIMLCIVLVSYILNNICVSVITILVTIVYSYFANRHIINNIIKKLTNKML